MTLRRRLVVTSLVVSVPVATGLYLATAWLRSRDMRVALERVVRSQLTEGVRAQCEADPQWFLAGPREAPPKPEERARPDADVLLPRPSTNPQPFEFFAYDDDFAASSTAGPRFPDDFKRILRFSAPSAIGPFTTSDGTGVQMAILTGWKGGPCAALLVRLRPAPHQTIDHLLLFGALGVSTLAAALLVAGETERRIRRVAEAARESARTEYSGVAPVIGRDEIGSLAFAFNEACVEIRRRIVEAKDRETALRRLVANTTDDVAQPLGALEERLNALDRDAMPSPAGRGELHRAILEVHHLAARLQNLNAAATLRLSSDSTVREPVDLTALVRRVVDRHQAVAHSAEVALEASAAPVVMSGDGSLLELAVSNLVDNAIRYNRPGGHVAIQLESGRDDRFSLRVVNDGPGVSEQNLARLTAVRRFRGDESRTQQPGSLGLGLAIVREVGDRFGLQWAFRRPPAGGFEAELAGPIAPPRRA